MSKDGKNIILYQSYTNNFAVFDGELNELGQVKDLIIKFNEADQTFSSWYIGPGG
jgi:hypothetical protein